jgi:hypothetical protein
MVCVSVVVGLVVQSLSLVLSLPHVSGWTIMSCEKMNLIVVWCWGLSKVWYGGEGCYLHGLLMFLLESAKDRFLGVDPQDNMCHNMFDMI